MWHHACQEKHFSPEKGSEKVIGRNRKFIRLLMKYMNLFSNYDKKIPGDTVVSLNAPL